MTVWQDCWHSSWYPSFGVPWWHHLEQTPLPDLFFLEPSVPITITATLLVAAQVSVYFPTVERVSSWIVFFSVSPPATVLMLIKQSSIVQCDCCRHRGEIWTSCFCGTTESFCWHWEPKSTTKGWIRLTQQRCRRLSGLRGSPTDRGCGFRGVEGC